MSFQPLQPIVEIHIDFNCKMTYYKEREKKIPEVKCWYPQTVVYNPIKAGSIDSTDIEPHDFGIVRAVNSTYKTNYKAKGNPLHTIFVGRLSLDTNEKDLENVNIIIVLNNILLCVCCSL